VQSKITLPFGDRFRLTFLTDDPQYAAQADLAGVNRIGVDLERLGKAERQAGLESWQSHHKLDDLARIAPSIASADLFARVNPIHPQTDSEIEAVLDLGVRVVMLPYFQTAAEVDRFVRTVRGRAWVIILVESTPALTRIREILAVSGIDEVMIGLNDLHLQLRVSNPFEVLASPLLDMVGSEMRRQGLCWGIGGVGRVDDRNLPIPADLVHAQYPRLGATGAWISRSFVKAMPSRGILKDDVHNLRNRLSQWAAETPAAQERAREELARRASQWAPASQSVA
jgi:HpcH/HpaI aldolase/citrate lyase family